LALASGGSVLEPAGTGFIRHGGSFSQLLPEATPTAPPLPKPCQTIPQRAAFVTAKHMQKVSDSFSVIFIKVILQKGSVKNVQSVCSAIHTFMYSQK